MQLDKPGAYKVVYQCEDISGNKATKARVVTVVAAPERLGSSRAEEAGLSERRPQKSRRHVGGLEGADAEMASSWLLNAAMIPHAHSHV